MANAHGAHVLHKLSLERVREVEVGSLDGPFGGERRGEGSDGEPAVTNLRESSLLAEVLLAGGEERAEGAAASHPPAASAAARAASERRRCAPAVDLVVDVGDVHDEADVVAEIIGHDAAQDFEVDVVARVAHVRAVVHRRAADVPPDAVPVEGDEGHLRAGEGVEPSLPPRVATRGQSRNRASVKSWPLTRCQVLGARCERGELRLRHGPRKESDCVQPPRVEPRSTRSRRAARSRSGCNKLGRYRFDDIQSHMPRTRRCGFSIDELVAYLVPGGSQKARVGIAET